MTDQPAPATEAAAPAPAPATPALPSDPWSIWFSRIIQIVGLGLVVYEAVVEHTDRPWLLLVASAMMLGGLGLQLVLRALLGRIEGQP